MTPALAAGSSKGASTQVGNSMPVSSLHTTAGLLQQSLSIVQLSPSEPPVQGEHTSGSLEQTEPPVPSGTHAQPQQSEGAVHGIASGTGSRHPADATACVASPPPPRSAATRSPGATPPPPGPPRSTTPAHSSPSTSVTPAGGG